MSTDWKDAGGVVHDPASVRAPRRVVSLVPSLTETFCAIGGREQLVGCTAFCIEPHDLLKDARVVKIGGTKTVLRERVMNLQPDLVLTNLEENQLDDIDWFKSRLECYCNGVKTLTDGIASIRELGKLIGHGEQAEPLAMQAEASLADLRRTAAERLSGHKPLRIFYAIWREPWMTINSDTFIHDHLRSCGGENVFGADASSRYPEVSIDAIRAAAPDVIWLPSEPYRFKEKHLAEFANFPDIPAVRNGRVELVNGDNVCWFGVRQIEGMRYTVGKLWR
jgi:ABC-type Fe3+-hydroxamate transport system substrate-binding protein